MNSQKVIIVHLRRANPTKHLLTSIHRSKEKLNRGRKVWDELCHYKTQGGLGRDLGQRRVTRIFLLNNINYQTTSKFYHRATTFYQRLPEKVVVSIISFTSKDCVPHNKYAYSSDSSSPRIKLELKKLHMLLTYRKFNQLIYFFSTNVNSSLVCLKWWRAVT